MEQRTKSIKRAYLISVSALYFSLISFLVIRFDVGYILSMLLYFAVPSIYFSLKNSIAIPKNLFYAFSFSVPTAIVLDYMAHVSNTWYVPSVFPVRMLGAFPAEEIVWSFLFFYMILASYNGVYRENFDSKVHSENNKYIMDNPAYHARFLFITTIE